jgi:hypothetical protein
VEGEVLESGRGDLGEWKVDVRKWLGQL